MIAADPLANVLNHLQGVRGAGDLKYMAKCPAHDDRHASLSVGVGQDGRVLLHCQAGCPAKSVLAAAGLKMADLFAPRVNGNGRHPHSSAKNAIGPKGPIGRIVATYDYTDRDGVLLFQAVRYEPKGFRQRRPDGKGGWVWSLGDVQRVLFRLPELMDADGRRGRGSDPAARSSGRGRTHILCRTLHPRKVQSMQSMART